MAGKSKKSIEITVKSTQLPSADAKDDPELLNLMVDAGKLILRTEKSSFKMEIESISHPQEFLDSLKVRFDEEKIEDITVTINSKLVI